MQPKVYLNKNEEYRIKAGHLWAFSNEIKNVENSPENGDLVELYDFRNNFLGTGFYNKNSLISIRLLSDKRIEDFYSFAEAKILRAYNLRKQFYPGRESFRMVFSESDFLPGLIIDKYNSSFVLQVYSFGMQKNLDKIVGILKREFGAKNIFTKNKEYFRKLEGLPVENEILSGSIENETINDGAIKYLIDFEKGHKTGFYFDQCDNRFFIERIVKGKNVLDGFCNSGGFGLHAAKAGASFVTFVDSSSTEIENAKRNFELNQLKIDSEFHNSDVFDYCNECIKSEKKFDVVMIDPPAFAKSKKDLRAAKKGYEKLNRIALQIINDNGFLVTSSCSHHINQNEFLQIINSALIKANKKIQQVYLNGASLDHPQLPAMSETTYLKFAVFRVFD